MLQYFLADVFGCPSLQDVQEVAASNAFIDMDAGTLHYAKLLSAPALRMSLGFAWLFRDVFGTYPSRLHLWDLARAHGAAQPATLASLSRVLAQRHGLLQALARLQPQSQAAVVDLAAAPDRQARFDAFAYSLHNNPAFVKDMVIDVVRDRLGLDAEPRAAAAGAASSLYARYKALFVEHGTPEAHYAEQARQVAAHGLLDACPLTRCPLPSPARAQPQLATVVDALRYAVHANTYLTRTLLQRAGGTVLVARDVGLATAAEVARELAKAHGKARLVVCETAAEGDAQLLPAHVWSSPFAAALLRRCLPTRFEFQHANPRAHVVVDARLLRERLGVEPFCHPSFAARAASDYVTAAAGGAARQSHARHLYRLYSRALGACPRHLPPASNDATVVVIDNRANPLSAAAATVTLANLQHAGGRWSLAVYTSRAAAPYYRELLPAGTQVRDHLPRLNADPEAFTIEDYNAILKGPELWRDLQQATGARVALLVQDDGMLVRPGLEASGLMEGCDYVGAPWADVPDNAPLKTLANPQMVGNGGLSLRNVAAHLAIAERCTPAQKLRLFFHDLQPVPEDVFFAGEVHRSAGGRVASREQASAFASEQVLHPGSLGFHKIWAYHPPADVDAFFEGCLTSDAAAAPPSAASSASQAADVVARLS